MTEKPFNAVKELREFRERHPMDAIEALKAISYQYENQDMSHVDFRVFAKQTADEAIAAAEQVSGVVVGELPSVNWRKGRRVYYCPECGTEQTEPETVSTPEQQGDKP